jgi:hypothetical protein
MAPPVFLIARLFCVALEPAAHHGDLGFLRLDDPHDRPPVCTSTGYPKSAFLDRLMARRYIRPMIAIGTHCGLRRRTSAPALVRDRC